MCLNEMYNGVCIVKHLFHAFPIQNGLKQGNAFAIALLLWFRICQDIHGGLELNGMH
jgi:hypothetical protein